MVGVSSGGGGGNDSVDSMSFSCCLFDSLSLVLVLLLLVLLFYLLLFLKSLTLFLRPAVRIQRDSDCVRAHLPDKEPRPESDQQKIQVSTLPARYQGGLDVV